MIQRLQQIARTKGGFCLSSTCMHEQKLLWQCSKGHQWYSTANSVAYSGSWCPVCAGNQKLSLIELKGIAEQNGGKCLATEYINSKTKLPWQCHNGHLWYATAFSIKTRKSWCPECYKSNRNAQLFNPIKNN
jgi:hypothetical protein